MSVKNIRRRVSEITHGNGDQESMVDAVIDMVDTGFSENDALELLEKIYDAVTHK